MKSQHLRLWMVVGIVTLIAFCAGAQTSTKQKKNSRSTSNSLLFNMTEQFQKNKNSSKNKILIDELTEIKCEDLRTDSNSVYEVVEKMPQFPGGDKALIEFISRNLKQPPIADCEHGIPGNVVLRFIVTKKGTITNVQVVRSLDPACDKEAIRIAKLFPKWIPGEQNGQKVDVYYTLPVSFNPNNYGK